MLTGTAEHFQVARDGGHVELLRLLGPRPDRVDIEYSDWAVTGRGAELGKTALDCCRLARGGAIESDDVSRCHRNLFTAH